MGSTLHSNHSHSSRDRDRSRSRRIASGILRSDIAHRIPDKTREEELYR